MTRVETTACVLAMNDLIGEHLRAGRAVRFTIPTTSMMPTFKPGDTVVVQSYDSSMLRVGDIVVRQVEEVWVAHRLVEHRVVTDQVVCVTKGDHQPHRDRVWHAASREGVVITLENNGQVKNLRARPIKILYQWIAQLSRAEAYWAEAPRTFLHRGARKACHLLMIAIASIARWIAR